jgi:cell division cycle 14
MDTDNIRGAIEIEKGRLYWISDATPPKCKTSKAIYFSIDDALVYQPFFEDFGPLNLSMTHKFCLELNKTLNKEKHKDYKIYHYTSLDAKKRSCAAVLMGAYIVIYKEKTAEEAWAFFENCPEFKPFRDALQGECTYKCTVLDCLRGIEYALKLGWYNPSTFKTQEYDYYEKVDNGDMNWVVPSKFLAFSSPSPSKFDQDGYRTFTPEDYCPIFKNWKVNLVVRLNNAVYDREKFIKNGVKHTDLFFEDGTTPPMKILDEFIKLSEKEKGGIAVHCKAGLGRTGSLIACYVMKHYRFPAAAFIGWIRICRPGSILGPQQHWLCSMEDTMFQKGDDYRAQNKLTDELCLKMNDIKLSNNTTQMSDLDKKILAEGKHDGQGNSLTNSKKVKK